MIYVLLDMKLCAVNNRVNQKYYNYLWDTCEISRGWFVVASILVPQYSLEKCV